ncbi:hypothetical protein ACFFX0_24445 [Citricoccus parietis]|uniref:Uncharacterized protein n=1 Tax=Citricoccus parietis TaxID=592307 RepID=A0ABV5G5F7_9MICC
MVRRGRGHPVRQHQRGGRIAESAGDHHEVPGLRRERVRGGGGAEVRDLFHGSTLLRAGARGGISAGRGLGGTFLRILPGL